MTRFFLSLMAACLIHGAAVADAPAQDGDPEPGAADIEPIEVTDPPDVTDALAQPDSPLVGPPHDPQTTSTAPSQNVSGPGFEILGQTLEPGELRQFNWHMDNSMAGVSVPTPVLVAQGSSGGSTVCLVAAIHGDELNGVEIVRRIMFSLNLDKLAGTVVGVPIANAFGFLRSSRYLPDRRDLNRYFPGTAHGSMASRFAHALFSNIILRCHVLVDIHTGSFFRVNLPQLRADLNLPDVVDLSRKFGDIAVLHSTGPAGSLRRAATDVGIPAVTLETGGPSRFQETAVDAGVEAIEAMLYQLGMLRRFRWRGDPQPVFYESTWVRAESGGILLASVQLGDTVEKGQSLGTVTDPIENRREELKAPFRGRILGMSLNRVVMPGFASFHVGRVADEHQAVASQADADTGPEMGDLHESPALEDLQLDGEIIEPAPSDRDAPPPDLNSPDAPEDPEETDG